MALKQQTAWVIGRYEETPKTSFNGGVCIAMLVIGTLWALFGTIGEDSAIRLAARGALWTGWSVVWGVGALLGRRRNYTVISFVEPPKDPPKVDVSTMVG